MRFRESFSENALQGSCAIDSNVDAFSFPIKMFSAFALKEKTSIYKAY